MGLGNTAKKLQTLADTAEKLYSRVTEIREQVRETQATVQETSDRVDRMEAELAEQRAILDELADREGIDVDSVIAGAHIAEAEATSTAVGDEDTDADADVDAGQEATSTDDASEGDDGQEIPVDENATD
jgi:DNA anti-recombination protein RmuC